MKNKILITGAKGQLGCELGKLLKKALLTDKEELDKIYSRTDETDD